MMFTKKNDEINRIFSEKKLPSGTQFYVLVDTETGVNYLAAMFGTSISVTPMLNPDGKPIITQI